MTAPVVLLTVALLIVAAVLARHYWARTAEANWRPPELENAELALAEKTFRARRPLRLIARLDRAYRSNGLLRLVEFKTRRRDTVYPTDIIELSAQRLAIQAETRERVANTAYVLIQRSWLRRSVHPVKLWSTVEIVRLAKRRADILDGNVAPNYAHNPGLCRTCAYRSECRPEIPLERRRPHDSSESQ